MSAFGGPVKAFSLPVLLVGFLASCGCPLVPPADQTPDPNDPGQDPGNTTKPVTWSKLFDFAGVGALSSVWGSSDTDVFVVGGKAAKGEIYHWNGSEWAGMAIPQTPILVWVYGFGPNDVWAVGVGGGVLHYDGTAWKKFDVGTTNDLWGVWGSGPNDLWIVGGRVGGDEPILIHYDGAVFSKWPMPPNDRDARALFKIWGIGSKIFAVGERGLIIQFENGAWKQVPTGADADEDFVSLWGTAEDNIVAVGGRASARVAHYDGANWTTRKFSEVAGLNGVCMLDPHTAVVGGSRGFVGTFNPVTGELLGESVDTAEAIHAMWADAAGRVYGVGGRFSEPYFGVAFLRTLGDAGIVPAPPKAAPPFVDDTPQITDCNGNGADDAADLASGLSADCDGDGVPDECQPDADGDGVPDACDKCPGDDTADADGDGVPDACDLCPGSDDAKDADGDGVPDGCDVCPGGNDKLDSDRDGTPNACDLCPGKDDRLDADSDGIPNGCDECVGNDLADSDGDGVADACDVCPGGDDNADADGDGAPDACDPCPQDSGDDSDGDGVCDGADLCPGFDDSVDLDGDGIPDGCDCFETDCELGFDCDGNGDCVPASVDLEIGVGTGAAYARVREYSDLTIECGFQGGSDIILTFRVAGMLPQGAPANVSMDFDVIRLDTGNNIVPWPFPLPITLNWNAELGVHEFPDYYLPLPFSAPESLNGQQVRIIVRFRDDELNPTREARSEVIVTLRPRCLQ